MRANKPALVGTLAWLHQVPKSKYASILVNDIHMISLAWFCTFHPTNVSFCLIVIYSLAFIAARKVINSLTSRKSFPYFHILDLHPRDTYILLTKKKEQAKLIEPHNEVVVAKLC
jgi:hypothetical protein